MSTQVAQCGPPPASEVDQCTDGVDYDCDLAADCADADHDGVDPACQPPDCSQFGSEQSRNAEPTRRRDNRRKILVPN